MGAALNAGRSVPRVGEEFGAVVDRNIGPLFDQSGNFTGQGYQDAMQQLRSAGAAFSQDGAMGNMASDATSQLQDAIDGIVARQAPDVAPQMQAAIAALCRLRTHRSAARTTLACSPPHNMAARLSTTPVALVAVARQLAVMSPVVNCSAMHKTSSLRPSPIAAPQAGYWLWHCQRP